MLNLLERVSPLPLLGSIYEYVHFVHLFLSSGASRGSICWSNFIHDTDIRCASVGPWNKENMYKEDDASFAVVISVSTPVDKPLPKERKTE
jgi:hypothetical protein